MKSGCCVKHSILKKEWSHVRPNVFDGTKGYFVDDILYVGLLAGRSKWDSKNYKVVCEALCFLVLFKTAFKSYSCKLLE